MNSEELKTIWKDHDSILERSVRLNLLCVEKIQTGKSRSKLIPVLILRLLESLILLKIILYLYGYLLKEISHTGFMISASVLIIFSGYALYLCLAQIIIIIQIRYSDSVTEIQRKLSLLQTHILDYFRLTFLMIPFWMVYPVVCFKIFGDVDITQHISPVWMISQLILLPFCIYIYRQISYKNIHKRWVRFLIKNAGGSSVEKASEFLNEIYEFEKE